MAQLKLGTTIDGQTAWHAGNDGPGSTLDADTVDGQHASAFALSGHSHALDGLSDVTITTPTDNEILAYNSGTSEWINQTAAEAGLATSTHDHDATYVNTAGDTMTGILDLGNNNIINAIMSTSTQGQGQVLTPGFLYNELSNWVGRGGTLTETPTNITTAGNLEYLYTPGLDGSSTRTYTPDLAGANVVLEYTGLNLPTYSDGGGSRVYLISRAGNLPDGVKIEILDGNSVWQTIVDDTSAVWRNQIYITSLISGLVLPHKGVRVTLTWDAAGGVFYFREIGYSHRNSPFGINAYPTVNLDTTIRGLWNYTITPTVDGNTIWHAGNDGVGSGLDADTLDGQDSSAFAISGHNHDADYVNITGDTMTGGLIVSGTVSEHLIATRQPGDTADRMYMTSESILYLGGNGTSDPISYINGWDDAGTRTITISSQALSVGGDATFNNSLTVNTDTILNTLDVQGEVVDFMLFNLANTGTTAIETKVTTDSFNRFNLYATGEMWWGDGTGSFDLGLMRSAANTMSLATGDSLIVPGDLTVDGSIIIDHVGTTGQVAFSYTNDENLSNFHATTIIDEFGALHWVKSGGGDTILSTRIDGDAEERFRINAQGELEWHNSVTGAVEGVLYKSAADVMGFTTKLIIDAPTADSHAVTRGYANSTYLQNLATGTDAFAIGLGTTNASSDRAIAIGFNAVSNAAESITIGDAANVDATANYAIAIGDLADADGASSIALGRGTYTGGTAGIAVGFGASAGAADSIAIGESTNVGGANGVGIGFGAIAWTDAVSIGRGASANHVDAAAIGRGATTTANNQGVLGVADGGTGPYNWVIPGNLTVNGTTTINGAGHTHLVSQVTNLFDSTVPQGLAPDGGSSTGSASTAARRDHTHNVSAGAAVTISNITTNTEGTSVQFARRDHTHAVTGFATQDYVDSGYRYKQTVVYTASSTFVKADYPGLRAVRVRVQGAGGGGNGSAINNSGGASGAAGGYAEAFYTASELDASCAVTVGAGGSGATGGGGGSAGSASSFVAMVGTPNTEVVANGGSPGASNNEGGTGGSATGGYLNVQGSDGASSGDASLFTTAGIFPGMSGGSAVLGGGGRGRSARAANAGGLAGNGYGSGGGGGFSRNASVDGGTGAPGIVLVDIYV